MIEARDEEVARLSGIVASTGSVVEEVKVLRTTKVEYDKLIEHALKNFTECKEHNIELAAQNKQFVQTCEQQAKALEERDARIFQLEAQLRAQSPLDAVERSEMSRALKQNDRLRNTVDQYSELVEHAAQNFRVSKEHNSELIAKNQAQATELEACASRIRELETALQVKVQPTTVDAATSKAQPTAQLQTQRPASTATTSVARSPVPRTPGPVKSSSSMRMRPSTIPSPGVPKPSPRVARGKENAAPKPAVVSSQAQPGKKTVSRIARPTMSRRPLVSVPVVKGA